MRAVIDTSVLVSGMLSKKSYPARVLDAWVFNRFSPVISPDLAKEYAAVLTRAKFDVLGPVEKRLQALERLLSFPWVVIAHPEEKIVVVSADPKDNTVLECAAGGKTPWVVSGDKHLLRLGSYKDITIVTAEQFAKVLRL
ncbi:predicted nucleic acid-binding protein [Pelotomaculum thermopropionicum SI]|uniref:Predicted nucleic acid-binding protein n=1 Tax=Pelotomaculum thermopropionicum (strain DSM 13744 / JCM 10971 / SI) TaxID=370438 RepID=A5D595_PELTS|nr:predicted nucleic acid-binding protein [Pelotomaculum thermopropionicum SI]